MIKVVQEVKVYKRNGKEAERDECVQVNSHYIWNDRVILMVDGVELEVIANDLLKAIENAQNTNRY